MEYPTSYTVVLDTPYFQLLCMKESNEHPDELLLGAIAGHQTQFSIDFREGKSVAGTAVRYSKGGVYVLHVKEPFWAGVFVVTYNTLLDQVEECIKFMDNGPVRLVGICQGGAMAALFVTRKPDLVRELVIAAAPINTSTPSSISPAQKFPLIAYQTTVNLNYGVMPGSLMLKAWMSINKELHEVESKKPENAYFYARYNEVQSIYGMAYIKMIQGWFLSLEFFNELDIRCPVQTIVGRKDKETPQEQVEAIQERCSLPITKHYVSGGHMATFGSAEAMKPDGVWSRIFRSE